MKPATHGHLVLSENKSKKKKKHKDAHRLLKYMPRNISGNKAGSLPPSFDLEHLSKSGLQVIHPGTHEIKL